MAYSLIPGSTKPPWLPPSLGGTAGVPQAPLPPWLRPPTGPVSWLPKSLGGTASSPSAPAGTPQYHTYKPGDPRGQWTLPKGATLAWKDKLGYYAKMGGAAAAGGGNLAPPKDPWTTLLTQLMGSYETPAQQEARVNREVDAQIAANKKMLDDEYQRQMRNAQGMAMGMSAAGQAAAAMSKDLFGAVGGEFNAAAGEIKGLSHGLTGAVGKQTGKDVGAANAELARTGAPEVGAGGSIFAPGGSLQAGVEDYRAGTLGAQMFGTQGEAANFGLAGMISSENMKATEEAKAALMTATREANDAQNKAISALAAGRGDLYHQYMSDAQDAQVKRITLAQGIQAATAAGTTKPITKTVSGSLYQWDPVGHKWVQQIKATPKAKTPVKLTTKEFADGIWSWNPVTGKKVKFLGKPPAGTPANLTYHDVLMPDGKYHTVGFDPKTGKRVPGVDLGVSKVQPTPPGSKSSSKDDKVTKEDMQQATQSVRDFGLLQKALEKLKKYNNLSRADAKKKGKTWNDITIDEISTAPANVISAMGLTDAELTQAKDPRKLQEVYVDLAASIGAKRAWQLIRRTYPNFGAGYFT